MSANGSVCWRYQQRFSEAISKIATFDRKNISCYKISDQNTELQRNLILKTNESLMCVKKVL